LKNLLRSLPPIVALWLVFTFALSCRSTVQPSASGPEALFLVRDETGEIVEHARVYVVTTNGTRMLTDTSDSPRARIPLEVQAEDGGTLLVCAEGYYCGGWMAGDPALELIDGESYLYLSITLAAVRLH